MYYCVVKECREVSARYPVTKLQDALGESRRSPDDMATSTISYEMQDAILAKDEVDVGCRSKEKLNKKFLVLMRLGDTPVLIPNTMVKP